MSLSRSSFLKFLRVKQILTMCSAAVLLISPVWSQSYTLTTASHPSLTLTQSTTFTDLAVPIKTIEESGKVTKTPFLNMILNRTGSTGGVVVGPYTVTDKFIYNSDDNSSSNYPQGMSTSSDSIGGSGLINNQYWVVETWDTPNNAFLSLMLYNYSTKSYRWVEMVQPYASTNEIGADFKAIPRHGDGIVWYGHYLYVADGCYGFRVFDTDHLWAISSWNGTDGYDTSVHQFHSNGRAYAMPQIGFYRFTNGWTCPSGFQGLAGASLNRGSNSYIIGWGLDGTITKWQFDATGLLALDQNNIAQPVDGWHLSMSTNDRLFATTVVGNQLYTSVEPAGVDCHAAAMLGKYPVTGGTDASPTQINGCTEAFANDPSGNRLWAVSEEPGNKITFAITPP